MRAALQASRNLPAVALLDAVGPAQLLARLRRAGVRAALPAGRAPGLAIALGGVGLTLDDLAALYAAIANGGDRRRRCTADPTRRHARRRACCQPAPPGRSPTSCRGAAPPANAAPGEIAFKTGTSYGHRDAWAIGFDGAHVVGVWFGRADGAAVPGALGLDVAAPSLFDAFARLKPRPAPLPPPPGALTLSTAALPPPLRRFEPHGTPLAVAGPEIAFPPDGARLDLGMAAQAPAPLTVRLEAGTPPFRWLVDGTPIAAPPFVREVTWQPDGAGFVSVAVIDAIGDSARTTLFVE